MIHFCLFNLEFAGLAYDFYEPSTISENQYGITYYELYKCKKCGMFIRKNKTYGEVETIRDLDIKIQYLENIGYLPLGKFVYEE